MTNFMINNRIDALKLNWRQFVYSNSRRRHLNVTVTKETNAEQEI